MGRGRAIDLSWEVMDMDGFAAAAALLPAELREALMALPSGTRRRCEELRLRRGRPGTVLAAGVERPFSARPVTEDTLRAVLEAATRSSFHAAAEQLRQGYLTAAGGVRVGVCGTAVPGPDGLEGLRAFSSLAVRVPREVRGCADGIWDRLTAGGFSSALILSPPGAGKTTLLRELIRRLSECGLRVGVADERGEIAGCADGEPGFDVGPCADVITGAPKAAAAGMLLRAMNPQILAMDEITDPADGRALLRAVGCGVELLATIHGESLETVRRRPVGRVLLDAGAFRRYVLVENDGGVRRYAVGELP